MSERPEIVIERVEFTPRAGGAYFRSWKWDYVVAGWHTHSLKLAKKRAQEKFPGHKVRLAWKESA